MGFSRIETKWGADGGRNDGCHHLDMLSSTGPWKSHSTPRQLMQRCLDLRTKISAIGKALQVSGMWILTEALGAGGGSGGQVK